jgi:hypothetical protein
MTEGKKSERKEGRKEGGGRDGEAVRKEGRENRKDEWAGRIGRKGRDREAGRKRAPISNLVGTEETLVAQTHTGRILI